MSQPVVTIWDEQPLINPCRILPTEVIAEIFERCLPSGPERLEAPLQRLAPLSLSWVCRSWRNLCLSLPILWTELAIGHRRSAPDEDARVLELWIVRSGYLPISLRLNYETDDEIRPVLFNRENHKKYHRRMQIFILLYIEAGSYIQEDEEGWEFAVLYVNEIYHMETVFDKFPHPQIRKEETSR